MCGVVKVAFGYEEDSEDIVVLGTGTEGLETLEKFFTPDAVVYAVLGVYDDEAEVEGYATLKYIFISWVGSNVKPTWKARSSQHRVLLYNYVNVSIPPIIFANYIFICGCMFCVIKVFLFLSLSLSFFLTTTQKHLQLAGELQALAREDISETLLKAKLKGVRNVEQK
jgi:hypothetical protein